MKVFAIFMTFFMLSAGLDLCRDNEALNSEEKVEISISAEGNHDTGNVCSPFCTCTRCPFSILLPLLAKSDTAFQSFKKIFTDARSGNPIQISPSVWQPPKLV